MKIRAKQLFLAAIAATLVLGTSVPADAGGCGSGRGGIGFSYGATLGPSRLRSPVYRGKPVTYTQRNRNVYVAPQRNVYVAPQRTIHVAPQPLTTQVIGQQPVSSIPVTSQVTTTPVTVRSVPVQTPSVTPTAPPAKPIASTSKPASPSPSSNVDAEASALEMLASINESNSQPTANQIPQFGAATANATSNSDAQHIGTWAVSLPGNQSVKLVLSADGKFVWTATKDGQSSSFEGQYRITNDRLSLVRSNDLQKMEGTWIGSSGGFTFTVDGENVGGLNFKRS